MYAAGHLAHVPSRRAARAILALGVGVGVVNLALLPAVRPEQLGLATAVYTTVAEAALAGEPFYGVSPPGLPGYHYLYPPVVVLAFLPYGLLGDAWLAYAVQTAITVAAGLALARLLWDAIERAGIELARIDRLLVAGFCLVSAHTSVTLVNGQLNVVLGLFAAVGFVALERCRSRLGGTALALAATVKLFPALFGAYLLRRRDWRAIGAATATGLGLLALGALAFGVEPTVAYLTEVLPAELKTGALAADPTTHDYLTVRRQLAALFPWLAAGWLPLLGVVAVAPVVLVTYRRLPTRLDRQLAVLATVIGTLLVLPLEAFYFPLAFYPLVVLLYALPAGRTRQLLVAGTLLTMVQVTPNAVEPLVDGGLLGPEFATLVDAVTAPFFRVILPPTVGMWLLLGAGVHWQLRGRPAPTDTVEGTGPTAAETD